MKIACFMCTYIIVGLTAMSILSSDVSKQLCQLSGFETTTNVDPSQVQGYSGIPL